MTAVRSARRHLPSAVSLLAALATLSCPAFNSREREIDRTPTVNTGAGASIIYPGQSPPVLQGPSRPAQPGQSATPSSGYPQQETHRRGGASGPASGGHITMIGGSTVEEQRHQKIEEAPIWWKYVRLPFVALAAPFVYAADRLSGEPEPGPEVPGAQRVQPAPPATTPPPEDYETATLRRLEDELDRRAAQTASRATPPRASSAGGSSLAEELAAMRRAREERTAPEPLRASAPAPNPTLPTRAPEPDDARLATASGHVDRDGDGRTDQWIFRERGEIVRELLDEDFDGRPDRTLHYDLASHQIHAIEEDSNHDGHPDTWTSLRDGAIVRRRTDGNADGHVDTWGYYKSGVLTRLERDASGDGFRDRVSHYENGRLIREEQDGDADGLAERVKHYDAEERIERLEEDTNGDGKIDVISHYEAGRLKRRELLDADLLTPAPSMSRVN